MKIYKYKMIILILSKNIFDNKVFQTILMLIRNKNFLIRQKKCNNTQKINKQRKLQNLISKILYNFQNLISIIEILVKIR